MNRVTVSIPTVDGHDLVGDVSTSGTVGRFFSGSPFRARYSESIDDLPASLRPVPVLAHVCPVAWATGADVVVERVDGLFLDGLREIRATLTELYPEFMDGGAVHSSQPVRDGPAPGDRDGTGMLFTGGVDSTTTYVRHREEDPTLIGVRGWAIDEGRERAWRRRCERIESFATERGHDAAFVESNMLSFLASPLLQAHFQRYLEGAWYSSVGHGLGLLGLCAPLAWANDLGTLHIAATHTNDWSQPWGSRPDIDEHVRWRGTTCSHDGYDLSRQDKIDLIGDYAAREDESLELRTCSYDEEDDNCSECEKCARTMLGLVLAGRDPNDFGYQFNRETFARIRKGFDESEWYVTDQKAYHWKVLQTTARERSIDADDETVAFFDWLDRQDFDDHVADSERSLQHRALQEIARTTPKPVYDALYPLYRRVASTPH